MYEVYSPQSNSNEDLPASVCTYVTSSSVPSCAHIWIFVYPVVISVYQSQMVIKCVPLKYMLDSLYVVNSA